MNDFFLDNTGMHIINPDVFFDALSHIFNIDEIGRLKLYWLDISEETDESIGNSELQLKQISYIHQNDKAEKLLYNYDENCFKINPDTTNQKFINAVAKYLLDDDTKNKFANIYIQYATQLEEYEKNKGDYLICGKKINGQLILTEFTES